MKLIPIFRLSQLVLLTSILAGVSACSMNKEAASVLLLDKGWLVQSSLKINESGEELSLAGSSEPGWYKANVPSTIFGSLVNEGIYQDIFFGKNLEKVDKKQFQSSWWYRKNFEVFNKDASTFNLEFDGIIYRANIWLNGKKIASSDTTAGPFRQFSLNVSNLVRRDAENVLAIEVFPPEAGDLTIGFVDWNPEAPDRGMGIWREVRLRCSGDVSLRYPFVQTNLDTTLKSAELIVSCEVTNNGLNEVSGYMDLIVENLHVSKKVMLQPGEMKRIEFSPEEYSALELKDPRVWWTHDLGEPELYNLKIQFIHKNSVSDVVETRFGIRNIESYKYFKYGKQHNGYKLNGKKIVIKGGGWVDQLFLMPDSLKLERQIEYVKHMNLNAIRPEGFWGNNHDLYNICDREGVLIMTGWSCQWEWPEYCGKKECDDLYGCIQTKEEIELISRSWKDMIKWLRNHPSIFMWMTGSDMLPLPELEEKYIAILNEEDPTRPMVTSAAMRKSTISGWSGMKMEGPYEYVPPVYWYVDTLYGGAYGFNTETGPGAQVPPIESIREMFPADSVWPENDIWEFHCGRNEFQTLARYNTAMNERFGKPGSLEEYCKKAQLLNYESIRPMFEAFQVNRYHATGIIQWMLNSSWPKLIWQLYGFDLLPNAALYGTKKALEPLQAIYDYGKNEIFVSNSSRENYKDLIVSIRVSNLDMKEILIKNIPFEIRQDENKIIYELPDFIEGLDPTYFLDLRIVSNQENTLAINQYLLTQTVNEFDWAKTYFVHTPTKKHQNLKQVNLLPAVQLESKLTSTTNYDKTNIIIELENPSKNLALSVELMLLEDKTGHFVAPVYLDDNYFSLLPGEKRIVKGYCYNRDLKGGMPELKVSGFNIK
jgi:exo-1,4-beta-D-glucosaminidase